MKEKSTDTEYVFFCYLDIKSQVRITATRLILIKFLKNIIIILYARQILKILHVPMTEKVKFS